MSWSHRSGWWTQPTSTSVSYSPHYSPSFLPEAFRLTWQVSHTIILALENMTKKKIFPLEDGRKSLYKYLAFDTITISLSARMSL